MRPSTSRPTLALEAAYANYKRKQARRAELARRRTWTGTQPPPWSSDQRVFL